MQRIRSALPHGQARTLAFCAAIAVTALLTACSGSPSSTGSGGASNAGGPENSQSTTSQKMLAFTHCMRTHGVPNFPDPSSDGKLPDFSARRLGLSDSQLHADEGPCVHLLPNGGVPTQAESQQLQIQALGFARCMRSHGMPDWPDPTTDRPGHWGFFDLQAVGIDLNSLQVRVKVQKCISLRHLPEAPPGAQINHM